MECGVLVEKKTKKLYKPFFPLTVSNSNVKVSMYLLCSVDVVWCVSTSDAVDCTGDSCHLSICPVNHSSLPQTSHVSDCLLLIGVLNVSVFYAGLFCYLCCFLYL